ncbi:calcium-binding protein 1a isoform X2 [Acanthochromis polyacanthus]|uniref:calcium-binding protein 1a isoform X2 n=1 Tax=Acanthochromis polyacanthus TaxID=80966 RepID=UPI0022342318|nr:calcium-binding protein 1a isoform X2 [Acanthochromis polyacanthus]
MSASFPKSDSTTSLLKSSSAAKRPTHLHEHTAESRRSQHHHQHQHQHHHRPAALHSSSSKAEESFWSAECDISARRPLCHPSLLGSQDSSNDAPTRGKCKSHAPHSQVPVPPPEPNGEAGRGVRERCRTSKPTHRHHHRRKHNREDRPPAAGPPETEHPRRCHTHSRPVPRVPSLSDSNDDRAPLCEPRSHKGAGLATGGGQVSSPSPSSCSLVPLSSRSSRRSRRSSAASSASDINLRTILNSLFGQDRELRPEEMDVGGHVDFEDFVELMGPKLLAETADMIGIKELKDAFREFDTNGDGAISTSELRDAMRKLLGQQVGLKEVEDILRDVDLNGDGLVDFEEFVRMMSR